jgi:hypothetical protein
MKNGKGIGYISILFLFNVQAYKKNLYVYNDVVQLHLFKLAYIMAIID